jgi:hypothetical protein
MNHNTVSNTEMNSSLKQKDLLQEKKQEKSVFNKDDEKKWLNLKYRNGRMHGHRKMFPHTFQFMQKFYSSKTII